MSRRIATDAGGRRGPQSSRSFGGRDENNRYRDNDRHADRSDRGGSSNPNNMPIGVMPSMPFPMNFGNMPAFPPGFQMPNFQQNKQD
jgi:protein NRD1